MSAELSSSMIPITINLRKRIDRSRTSTFLFRRMNINGQVCASIIYKEADNIPLVLACLLEIRGEVDFMSLSCCS